MAISVINFYIDRDIVNFWQFSIKIYFMKMSYSTNKNIKQAAEIMEIGGLFFYNRCWKDKF